MMPRDLGWGRVRRRAEWLSQRERKILKEVGLRPQKNGRKDPRESDQGAEKRLPPG